MSDLRVLAVGDRSATWNTKPDCLAALGVGEAFHRSRTAPPTSQLATTNARPAHSQLARGTLNAPRTKQTSARSKQRVDAFIGGALPCEVGPKGGAGALTEYRPRAHREMWPGACGFVGRGTWLGDSAPTWTIRQGLAIGRQVGRHWLHSTT